MKRIAVLTSGGDAPGMNAAVRAVVRAASAAGVDVQGVRRGFAGLVSSQIAPLGTRDVSGIVERGGTILQSARCPEFSQRAVQEKALQVLDQREIDGLIVVGGNGSQTGAHALSALGFPVCGIASTIDNDLCGSDITIGVDTALNVIIDALDRLRTTLASHRRLSVVEVMGRQCGYLALAAGIAGGAEGIVTPECDHAPDDVLALIEAAYARGKEHALIVVAEGATHTARALHDYLTTHHSPLDPRLTILGHVQRGGSPTAFDRILATRLGTHATELLLSGASGNLAGLIDDRVCATPLAAVVGKTKPLPADLLRLAELMH